MRLVPGQRETRRRSRMSRWLGSGPVPPQEFWDPSMKGRSEFPEWRIMREYVWNLTRRVDCDILGTVPWYPHMRSQRVMRGRFFTSQEMEDRVYVCVIGSEMADMLFPLDSPIGGSVRVGESYYRVVGVMEPKGRGTAEQEGAAQPSGGMTL